MLLPNRTAAGKQLSRLLNHYQRQPNTIVLGLPRGGVVVAAEVARGLHLPLDIIVTRKIGAPFNQEFAIGAITSDGDILLDEEVNRTYDIDPAYIQTEVQTQQREAQRRLQVYRGTRLPLDLNGKIVLLVDDGIATGLTMAAAIATVKKQQPKKIVLVAPVGAQDALDRLRPQVDEVIVPHVPVFFGAIGEFYREFSEVSDSTVIKLLQS